MAHVYHVQPIPGVEDLYGLLAFLTDPSKYKAHLDKLETLRAECNGLIEKVGKAEQIETMVGQAAIAKRDADQLLKDTAVQAKAILYSANAEAEDVRKSADAYATKRQVSLDARADDIAVMQKVVNDAEANLAQRADVVTSRALAAGSLMSHATALKDEYETKVAKLRAAGL